MKKRLFMPHNQLGGWVSRGILSIYFCIATKKSLTKLSMHQSIDFIFEVFLPEESQKG